MDNSASMSTHRTVLYINGTNRYLFDLESRLDDNGVFQICRKAIRAWAELPETVSLSSTKFSCGTHSVVRKIQLHGDGWESIKPQACVYRFIPVEDRYGRQSVEAQQANEKFVVAAGKAGVAPYVYMAEGKHRVIEYCEGQGLFGGDKAHFINWGVKKCEPPQFRNNCPSDLVLMAAAGKAIGTVHSQPLTWLSEVVSADEFEKRMAEPLLFPTYFRHCSKSKSIAAIAQRTRDSKVLPQSGLFSQPCSCHMDLHGGNMILQSDKQVRIIDWEFVCLGHRGQDLSYFFLNSPGSTLESRRAFAHAYLETVGSDASAVCVDEFLLNVERCMPLALVVNACITTKLVPQKTARVCKLTQHVLDYLEARGMQLADDPQVLDQGVVRKMLDEHPDRMCCDIM